MVDLFSREYGWSIDQTFDLTFCGMICLIERIKARYPDEKGKGKGIDTSQMGLDDLKKRIGG